MITTPEINAVRESVRVARREGKRVGFVPTMGALHAGHFSLIDHARKECDFVVVSIFVNPTQFGPNEDLDAYPRTIEADLAGCEQRGVGLVFMPTPVIMYRSDAATTVHVDRLTAGLCGKDRPVHFDGVTTVVTKLFNIVMPDVAFFGEKDYQQLTVIRRMVRDLDIPVEVVGCPTVREADGLAMSSRNNYLSTAARQQATCLHRSLERGASLIQTGERDAGKVIAAMEEIIHEAGPASIDYIAIVNPDSLEPVLEISEAVRIVMAVRIEETRLIDNLCAVPG